jgi:hypothetical protein
MRTAFKALMGFAVGYLLAFVCGFGHYFGLLGVIIPAARVAVVFVNLDLNLTARIVKTTPGYWLLASGRFIGGCAVGLFLAMLAGTLIVKWLDPACAAGGCKVPDVFGFAGLIGGGVGGLLYFRWKTARTLPSKTTA